jgi:hypothetical protein
MSDKKLTYVIDVDNTICSQTHNDKPDYMLATPFTDRIKRINALYEAGNTIIMYTARGMGRSNGDVAIAYDEMYRFTDDQLKSWGLRYHRLQLGKPLAHVYVDDRAVHANDFFEDDLSKQQCF